MARRQLGEQFPPLAPHRGEQPGDRGDGGEHGDVRQEVLHARARPVRGEDAVEDALAQQHHGAGAEAAHDLQCDRDGRLARAGRPHDPQGRRDQAGQLPAPARRVQAVQVVDREAGLRGLGVGGHLRSLLHRGDTSAAADALLSPALTPPAEAGDGARAAASRAGAQSGMLPCLRCGPGSRLVCSVSSAAMSFGRVSCGMITSSM